MHKVFTALMALCFLMQPVFAQNKTCENYCDNKQNFNYNGRLDKTQNCVYDKIFCKYGCWNFDGVHPNCITFEQYMQSCEGKCRNLAAYTDYVTFNECRADCLSQVGLPPSSCVGSNCTETCDNGIDDDGNALVDCQDPACGDSFACGCRKEAGGAWNKVTSGTEAGKLNIVFVGKNYDTLDESIREQRFIKDLGNAVSGFRDSEPFKSSQSKMRFYAFRIPASPSSYAYMNPKAAGVAACRTNGNDQYIILDAIQSHGNSNAKLCGGIATVYTSSEADYGVRGLALHEFGHSFGCLWDEYAYVPKNTGWFQAYWPNLLLHKAGYAWHKFSYDQSNCVTNVTNADDCEAYFDSMGVPNQLCWSECTSPNWWRSSVDSVMRNAWTSDEYNKVSQFLISKKLDAYT